MEPSYTVPYQPERLNTYGALIFVSYILAALILSFTIVRQLHGKYWQISYLKNVSLRPFRLRVLTGLTVLSFSALSFNMLSFLIHSFNQFVVAKRAALDSESSRPLLHDVWQWMTTSTLFTDFAIQLIGAGMPANWTSRSLRSHLLAVLYIGNLARSYKLHASFLWSIYALAQILPSSFALNLFFIGTVLHESQLKSLDDGSGPIWGAFLSLWKSGLGIWPTFEGFSRFLDVVKASQSVEHLLTMVLATRVFLSFACQIPFSLASIEAYFLGCFVWNLMDEALPGRVYWLFGDASSGLFAVRALAVDNLILTMSICIYILFRVQQAPLRANSGQLKPT